jgi:ATP-dependent Clp protease ATP-binding subunit ClpA
MFERLDERSRRVLDLAQQHARDLGHHHLGTEHLLYGLACSEGIVADLLGERGCRPPDVTREIVTLIGLGDPPNHQPDALLAALGIDLAQVRERVEATFGSDAVTRVITRTTPRRRWWPARRWWPGCRDGQLHPSTLLGTRWLGLAPRVKKVLHIAVQLSAPRPVPPELLLVAILDEGEGLACQILTRRGVDLTELRTALQDAHDSR